MATKFKFIVLLFLPSIFSQAQQDPIYSQYLLNPLVINPAYAGINNNLHVAASYRIQWMGLEGQPKTINLNGSTSLVNNKVGVGATLLQDKIGGTTVTEFNASFAYKLQLKNETTFSFGMQGGAIGFKTDNSDLMVRHPGDDAFPDGTTRATKINIGAGAILMGEKYMIGLSVPRLLPSSINSGTQQFDLYNQHFYLFGSYVHFINEHIRLKPAVLLRAVSGAPASTDLAMNVNINLIHTAGLFTRNFNTIGVLLQTMLSEKYRFAYVFELPGKKSVGAMFPTHEISIGVRMGILNFHNRSLTTF